MAIAKNNSTGGGLIDDDKMETEVIDLVKDSDKDAEMTNEGTNAKRVSGSPGSPGKKTRTTIDKTNAQECWGVTNICDWAC